MAKKGYTVNWDLDHNKKSYKEGATVQLDEKEAESLLGFGVISEMKKQKKTKEPAKTQVVQDETASDTDQDANAGDDTAAQDQE